MQRIREELDQSGRKYRILNWLEIKLPLKNFPRYLMINFSNMMCYRDDLIYGLCIMEEFIRAGTKIYPPLKGFNKNDKFSNFLLCNRYLSPIQMPATLCTINLSEGVEFMREYREIIFKPIVGSQGKGIEVVETENRLKELLEQHHCLYLQELIQDRGYDIRTLLVGDQFVTQYGRYNPNEFRKNIHLGAVPKSVTEMKELDPKFDHFASESRRIAEKVREISDLDIVGVDTLPSKDDRTYLIEWNSTPGFMGAEKATKTNIAGKFVECFFND